MDTLESIITTYPVPTLVVVAVVVFLGGRLRGDGSGTTVRHVGIALACYLFAFGMLSWAEIDSSRMWLLVGALVIVAVAAIVSIARSRTRRRPTL